MAKVQDVFNAAQKDLGEVSNVNVIWESDADGNFTGTVTLQGKQATITLTAAEAVRKFRPTVVGFIKANKDAFEFAKSEGGRGGSKKGAFAPVAPEAPNGNKKK